MDMKKLVIYTAVFGKKAKLLTPTFIHKGIDLVCFTDDPELRSDVWDVRCENSQSEIPWKSAKMYKILPHVYFPEYMYSIWVDGNVVIKNDLSKLLSYLTEDKTFAAYNHSESTPPVDCIYCEGARLLSLIEEDKIVLDPEPIKKQMMRLHNESYPPHTGLIAGMVLVRKHNDFMCIKNMQTWWNEIEQGSSRDELSFNYIAWKNNFMFNYIPGYCCENDFFSNKKYTKI
jgi:lipopolysaccharide biosynthesis glycosyltransferase